MIQNFYHKSKKKLAKVLSTFLINRQCVLEILSLKIYAIKFDNQFLSNKRNVDLAIHQACKQPVYDKQLLLPKKVSPSKMKKSSQLMMIKFFNFCSCVSEINLIIKFRSLEDKKFLQ